MRVMIYQMNSRGFQFTLAVLKVLKRTRLATNFLNKKRTGLTQLRRQCEASVENRTTRDMRRYDLLATSLPQQHEHQMFLCHLHPRQDQKGGASRQIHAQEC